MNYNTRYYKPFFSLTTKSSSVLLLSVIVPFDNPKELTSDPYLRLENGFYYLDIYTTEQERGNIWFKREYDINLNNAPSVKCVNLRVYDSDKIVPELMGTSVAYLDWADPGKLDTLSPHLHIAKVPSSGLFSVGVHIMLPQTTNWLVKEVSDQRISGERGNSFVRLFNVRIGNSSFHESYIFEEITFKKIDVENEMWIDIEVDKALSGKSKGTVAHGDADEKPGPEKK